MTNYREILRISALGLSQQNIAYSCNVFKKTVNRILRKAQEANISWPLDNDQTNAVLATQLLDETQEWALSAGYQESDVNGIIKSVRKRKRL